MRHIGVDLHKTNFVVCFLHEDETTRLESFPSTLVGIADFIHQLEPTDEVAVEVTANIYYFYDQVKPYVSRIMLVDTYRFSVIATSKKKTDKADARAPRPVSETQSSAGSACRVREDQAASSLATSEGNTRRDANEAEEHGARRADSKWHCVAAFSFRFHCQSRTPRPRVMT